MNEPAPPLNEAQIRAELFRLEEALAVLLNPHTMTPTEQKIYTECKLNLGKHLTLNPAVPAEVGCCEAGSKILELAGVAVPTQGIAGTPEMLDWLKTNKTFEEIDALEQGAILLYVTGQGNGVVEGHFLFVGAFGVTYPQDWGLMSNESSTGNFEEQWCYQTAKAYYEGVGGLTPYIFRAL